MNEAMHTPGRMNESCGGLVIEGIISMMPYTNACDGHVINGKENLENARRLAACWNACQGISTDDLEQMCDAQECHSPVKAMQEQLESLQAWKARSDDWKDTLASRNQQLVEKMRDVVLLKNELLEALEVTLSYACDGTYVNFDDVSKVIAKAKGGAK